MAHAVFDSESIERQFHEEQAEKQHQIVADELGKILAEAQYIEEGDFVNMERQAGRKLTEEDFERRVTKLNPNLIFKQRPMTNNECDFCEIDRGSWLKTLVWLKNDTEQALVGYQKLPVLNEFDIVKVRAKIVGRILPRNSKQNMITDLPEYKIEHNLDGTPNVIFNGLNNLQQKIYEPCGRIVGWRSTLARAIVLGAINLDAAEREFDSADRETWAAKVGKQNLIVNI